ncbi:MAG: hypothetical protein KKA55_07875 [Proteobacteria bacterium]|nr:hypothetical protein [Pseudomonadota bacterium]MBU1595436.1 hypothetical protein [Pseudomonadota bacterium]
MPAPAHISLKREPQGRIAQRTLRLGDSTETRRYAYDSAGRLARVTDERNGLVESYAYDHQGRRLADINPARFVGERRYSYLPGNRLGQAGSVQYGHDKAGFRSLKVERTPQGEAATRYHYEPSGLLQHVDLPDGRRIKYVYDSSGLRTEKRVNGRVTEAFRWLDPLRLSEFHDGREWWRLAYLEGRTPVGVTNGEASYFLLADHLGTPLALATPDGSIVQWMRYDAFGNLLAQRGDVVRLPLGFAGGLYDADTGLTRFVWRDYDADTGRFTALDPLREKGGDPDWYGYCVDDPVNRVDVWGLAGEEAGNDSKPYFCEWGWAKCDDNGTMQGKYNPIEGDKDTLPFLLDFSVPIGGKRYTILPDLVVDPFRAIYERKQSQ